MESLKCRCFIRMLGGFRSFDKHFNAHKKGAIGSFFNG